VAAAVATFLAGSYMAYRGVDFPDRNFKPLYRQMRQILASDPAFARASEAERREMYEQTAILGTHLALSREALKQRPDREAEERVRAAGRDYLRQFLKLDPERVRITDQGLVVVLPANRLKDRHVHLAVRPVGQPVDDRGAAVRDGARSAARAGRRHAGGRHAR
jgi:hypothetical protein